MEEKEREVMQKDAGVEAMDIRCSAHSINVQLLINVRLQITTGRYRTKHGQAIRTEFIEEFVLPAWTC